MLRFISFVLVGVSAAMNECDKSLSRCKLNLVIEVDSRKGCLEGMHEKLKRCSVDIFASCAPVDIVGTMRRFNEIVRTQLEALEGNLEWRRKSMAFYEALLRLNSAVLRVTSQSENEQIMDDVRRNQFPSFVDLELSETWQELKRRVANPNDLEETIAYVLKAHRYDLSRDLGADGAGRDALMQRLMTTDFCGSHPDGASIATRFLDELVKERQGHSAIQV